MRRRSTAERVVTRTRRLEALSGMAVLCLVAVAVSGCGGEADDRVAAASGSAAAGTTEPVSTATPSSSPSPRTPTPAGTPTAPPLDQSVLVGRWSSVDQGRAQFVYEFGADGSFTWVAVNLQLLPTGTTRLTVRAEGTYQVSQGSIAFTPARATRTFEDPGDPARNFADQPYELAPWFGQSSMDAAGRLLLADVGGKSRTYARVP